MALVISGSVGFGIAMIFLNPGLSSLLEPDYRRAMSRFGESLRLAHAKYVDENQSDFSGLADRAIDGMVSGLDRHSSYYPPLEYKAFQDDTHRRYLGVGVMIRKVDKGVFLTKVFPGGPAEKAGLKVGEFILEVNGESVKGWKLDEVSAEVKGEKGTFVDLLLLAYDGKERTVRVRRDEIEISSVEDASVDEDGTGYLHLIQFTERTAQEVEEALNELRNQGMERLILDLRDNSGGLLSAAIEVADIFLEKDRLIVSVKGREGANSRDFRSTTSQLIVEPLVILLNEGSASASEIVAGAFSVLGRARLVGEQSYGKGSVQTIFPLGDGSGLRLTTAMYFLPDGSTIHEQGIEPDVLVPCSEANETKLRTQRYGDPSLTSREFEELFGFARIPDLQKSKALDLLTGESNATAQ
jgi:carboxyl-terminal processing protease